MNAYFENIATALNEAGVGRPVLVIDKLRLDQNLAHLKSVIAGGFHYRVVAKSLPCIPLLRYVLEACGTRRLMCFHMPFLLRLMDAFPDADVLLGKPMPVRALGYFEAWAAARGVVPAAQSYQRVQWLVDSTDRLQAYEAFARRHKRQLRISLELDLGLHRGGFDSAASFVEALKCIQSSTHLSLSGLMGYEAHITKIPAWLGGWQREERRVKARYAQFVALLERQGFSAETLCLNVGGSTTYPLYQEDDLVFCNELSVASALVKPSDFDVFTLAHHEPAMWIATPVLKKLERVRLPGPGVLSEVLRRLGVLAKKGAFIYGGNWLADPVYPAGARRVTLFGHSSNQELYGLPQSAGIKAEDWFFLRPRQSEAVMLQFGRIALLEGERIAQWWPVLDGPDGLDSGFEVLADNSSAPSTHKGSH